MLSYKGFIAEVDYDDNAEVFAGTVINASPIMWFRGAYVSELKTSLADVVDSGKPDVGHAPGN